MQKVILAAFIMSGAAIGSGVLALPTLASGPGFWLSILSIAFTCLISFYISFISVDMYASYNSLDINSATLSEDYFGKKGYYFSIIVNVISMLTCITAYTSAGGNLLSKTILPMLHLSDFSGSLIFCLCFVPVFTFGVLLVSRLNSVVFSVKIILLFGAILLGSSLFNFSNTTLDFANIKYIGTAASTFFCIWAMQMTIPIVLKVTKLNTRDAKNAVILAFIIAVVLYLGWLLLIFSVIDRQQIASFDNLGAMLNFIFAQPDVSKNIATLVKSFSLITVITSFLSIGFSLVLFTLDAIKLKVTMLSRFFTALALFVIPLIVVYVKPDSFIMIYQQSNIFIILSAILPVMAYFMKEYNDGKFRIFTLFVIISLLLIVLSQVLDDIGLMPHFI